MASKLRRCRAEHGQRPNLRCQERLPEYVRCNTHWAIDERGETVRWMDIVAVYPEIDSPLYTAAVREELADVPVPVSERQVGGDHYRKHKIQPWDIWEAYGLNAFEGSIIKYLLRYKDKNGVEDLKKARHTLDKLIELEEGGRGGS